MTGEDKRILVAADVRRIDPLLRARLNAQGYVITEVLSFAEVPHVLATETQDLVIFDLVDPNSDTVEVIRSVRSSSQMPIIIISNRDSSPIKIAALDAGADDYVTKPFGMDELMARLRVALRHQGKGLGESPIYACGGLRVDLARRLVSLCGNPVRLTPKEFGILRELVVHAGKVITHRHLLTEVWGKQDRAAAAYIRIYIRQLRIKVEKDPARPELVLTEPGVGYRIRANNAQSTAPST